MNTGNYGHSRSVECDFEAWAREEEENRVRRLESELGQVNTRLRELAKQRLEDIDKLRAQYVEYLNLAIDRREKKEFDLANYWQGRADAIYLAVEMLSA